MASAPGQSNTVRPPAENTQGTGRRIALATDPKALCATFGDRRPETRNTGPDEIRLIRRCQSMATKVFDPEFLRPAREFVVAG
jgi:hypothetical protein